jgi:hypothetical protein
MVGFGARKQCEPLYRQLLAKLSDEALDRELRHVCWFLKNTPDGPHCEDVWKQDCLKEEFRKRGRIPDGGLD